MAREAEKEQEREQCGACAWSCACACNNIPTPNLNRMQWLSSGCTQAWRGWRRLL